MHSAKTRFIVYCAAFLALAVLFSSFSIYFGPALRVSLSPAVVIYAGVVLGPVAGACIGAASDVLSLLVKPMSGAFLPGFTITFAVYGFLGGLLYRTRSGRHPGIWQITGATAVIQLVCSAFLNTFWLVSLTDTPFPALFPTRLPLTAVGDVLYTVILAVLIRWQDRIVQKPLSPAR